MSAITTKIIEKYNLSSKMGISDLSQYTSEFLENLTDDKKRNQARRCLRNGFKFSSEQVGVLISNQRSGKNKTINLVKGNCRIAITKPPKSLEEEIIRKKAKQILQNRYGFSEDQVNALFTILKNKNKLSIRDVRAEAYALALSAKNANAGSSCLTRLRRELRNLNASLKIIEVTKFSDITEDANKIQSVNQKKAEAKRIDYPDEFTLESVKERLDAYDIKTLTDCQTLADVMVMLCIRPAELKTLCITDAGVTGYAKNRDYDLIPKYLHKLRAVYGAVAHEAKNMAHTYTIAGECLHHSSDNHTSPVQNYIVVNYRKRGDSEPDPDLDEDSDAVSLKIVFFLLASDSVRFLREISGRKNLVKVLIDTTSKYNTISKHLFDKLESDHRLEGIVGDDLIGEEIKGLDLQFHIKRNEAKISFGHSPKTHVHHAKIVIDGMSISLFDEDFNKASSTKNNLSKSTESKPGLAQEE
ncbi:687_t:CDS:2, partial [Cetraspora pellucida]